MVGDGKKYFNGLLQKVTGLYCVMVTDRDGAPLFRVQNDKVPELAMKPTFLSTFTMATDQSSKLGIGRNQTIICIYNNYQVCGNEIIDNSNSDHCVEFQVVQMNKLPLIITFIGNENFNTGHILALESQIEEHLEDVKSAVTEA